MAYNPIAGIAPQYKEQAGYWIKFYQQATSNPILMSIDADGTTLTLTYFLLNQRRLTTILLTL